MKKILTLAATLVSGAVFAQGIVMHNGMPAYNLMGWGFDPIIVDARLVNGKLELEYRRQSTHFANSGGVFGAPDVWKDIYAASNGVIVFEQRVQGKVIPAQTTPERVEWPAYATWPGASNDWAAALTSDGVAITGWETNSEPVVSNGPCSNQRVTP